MALFYSWLRLLRTGRSLGPGLSTEMLKIAFLLGWVLLAAADDPIVYFFAQCPDRNTEPPSLDLTADVPAFAVAMCKNGEKTFTETDKVHYSLAGSFAQSYTGEDCLFYKMDGSNTYIVDVEVGWGKKDNEIIQQHTIQTISCSYDDYGSAITPKGTITSWFLNPTDVSTVIGRNSTAVFNLKVMDILDEEITTDHISIGRKVRLVAEDTSGHVPGFRALSCVAQNSVDHYHILRAGCGDGLVFPRVSGFETVGKRVFSPFFGAFKLAKGGDSVHFQCTFTECQEPCNGDSCAVIPQDTHQRRSLYNNLEDSSFVLGSRHFNTR